MYPFHVLSIRAAFATLYIIPLIPQYRQQESPFLPLNNHRHPICSHPSSQACFSSSISQANIRIRQVPQGE